MANSADVTFRVTEPDNRQRFPDFAKPTEIGHFSRNGKDQQSWDKSQLASYDPPDSIEVLKLDLNDDYGQQIEQRQRIPGCLDYLLRWILETSSGSGTESPSHRGITALKNAIYGADLVCWRGVLTKLASTPYERQEGWMVGAVRFGDMIFLVEFETESTKQRNAQLSDREKRMIYWGHRFELYVTTSTRNTSSNPVVDCNEQFCAIYRTKLGPPGSDSSSPLFRLIYGAEIDCVDKNDQYIELKTSRVIEGARQDRNFRRFKLLKWWLQSFLAGIDRIICGHRDDAGIIKYLKTYPVSDMPKMAVDGMGTNAMWSGAACMNFLYELLAFVETQTPHPAANGSLGEISVFEFDPRSRMVRLVKNHDYTSDQVLPDWFVSKLGKV